MNKDIRMSVSSMTRTGDKKAVYVFFQDGDNTAEFTLPGCELGKIKVSQKMISVSLKITLIMNRILSLLWLSRSTLSRL